MSPAGVQPLEANDVMLFSYDISIIWNDTSHTPVKECYCGAPEVVTGEVILCE